MLLTEAKRTKQKLNIVTLFSGMGAPEIALKKMGIPYNILLASDIDSDAQLIYKAVHGKELGKDGQFIPNVYDILDKVKDRLSSYQDKVDLLVAGFPCQAFSAAGTNYGFGKRTVCTLDNNGNPNSKKFVINAKIHLKKGSSVKPGTIHKLITDVGSHPAGTQVYILPESDGTLAIETIKIIRALKPKVAILENVTRFGIAKMDVEDMDYADSMLKESSYLPSSKSLGYGQSGVVEFSDEPGKRGSFGGYLKKTFDSIGYSLYPMYLDPTTYTSNESIMRRPRIYMVAIRSDINDRVMPTKAGENFVDKIENAFGINPGQNGKTDKELLSATVNKILSSGDANNFMASNAKDLFISLVGRIGHGRLTNAVDGVVNEILKNEDFKNQLLRHSVKIDQLDIKNLALKAEAILDKKTNIKNTYSSRQPRIIDLQDNIESLNQYYGKLIDTYCGKYFDGQFKNNLLPIVPINKSAEEYADIRGTYSTRKKAEQDFEQDIVAIHNNGATAKQQYEAAHLIQQLKIKVAAELIKLYLSFSKNTDFIPTVMRGHTYPGAHGQASAATYYILRNEKGRIKAGYLTPEILMHFMGMELTKNKNISIENNQLYEIMKASVLSKKKPSYNTIVARIGNSMNVNVLEKLIGSLVKLKAFN